MRIALDAMGGDFAPNPNIQGAIAAVEADESLEVVLVGDRAQLEKLLEESGYSGKQLSILEAEDWIGMEEKPTEALRKKPNCSIALCWRAMAAKEVDAVVSAGHTGAVVAAGLRTRLFLKNVKRPGIAVALPTMKGRSILMDIGANPAARPEHLYQYGVMASIYAREFLRIENPRVGLMNIGSEEGKGNDLYRETHAVLSRSDLKDRYVGNVEGRGLYQGEADVLVCEGFVGNVVLKVSEGIADFLIRAVAKELLESLQVEKSQAAVAFERLHANFHYKGTGGAPLLGIDGICMICHGSSDATSITNALKAATAIEHRHINSQIVEALSEQGGE